MLSKPWHCWITDTMKFPVFPSASAWALFCRGSAVTRIKNIPVYTPSHHFSLVVVLLVLALTIA